MSEEEKESETSDTKSEPKVEAKPDAKSEPKVEAEAKAEAETEAKAEAETKAEAEAATEAKAEAKSEATPESKPEVKAESKSESESQITFGALVSLLDMESRPASKVGWFLRVAVTLVAAVMLLRGAQALVGPMLRTKPPPPIPSEELQGDKFRLTEAERKEIFREFATAEIAERARGISQNTWNGHAWSREDDRGYIERTTARAAAARHHCSLSQVYLVLDEGIREKWPGPDGKPLAGNTPPHNPRTTW